MKSIQDAIEAVVGFRDARDWKQFHSARNLAAAISIEAGELQEVLLWKTDHEVSEFLRTPEGHKAVVNELADVLIFALLMCADTGVNPIEAIRDKVALNENRYPVDRAKGKADKYDRLGSS